MNTNIINKKIYQNKNQPIEYRYKLYYKNKYDKNFVDSMRFGRILFIFS